MPTDSLVPSSNLTPDVVANGGTNISPTTLVQFDYSSTSVAAQAAVNLSHTHAINSYVTSIMYGGVTAQAGSGAKTTTTTTTTTTTIVSPSRIAANVARDYYYVTFKIFNLNYISDYSTIDNRFLPRPRAACPTSWPTTCAMIMLY